MAAPGGALAGVLVTRVLATGARRVAVPSVGRRTVHTTRVTGVVVGTVVAVPVAPPAAPGRPYAATRVCHILGLAGLDYRRETSVVLSLRDGLRSRNRPEKNIKRTKRGPQRHIIISDLLPPPS